MLRLITSAWVQQQAFDISQKKKKKSKISTSEVNFGFKIGGIDMKSTRISVRKEIYSKVGDDRILFLGEKCFYTNVTNGSL